jgi:hypothetical protein
VAAAAGARAVRAVPGPGAVGAVRARRGPGRDREAKYADRKQGAPESHVVAVGPETPPAERVQANLDTSNLECARKNLDACAPAPQKGFGGCSALRRVAGGGAAVGRRLLCVSGL